MHDYYEMSIEQVCALSTPVFLEMCSLYLAAANKRDERAAINRQAREYGVRFGIKMGPMWMLDCMLDYESYEANGGDIDPGEQASS